jgi:hypothetical protein
MSTDNEVPTLCSCGRDNNRIHCPHPDCGSYAKYPMATKAFTVGTVRVMVYRCRSCGKIYHDLERKFCQAPQLKPKHNQPPPPTPFAQELEGLTREEQMRRIAARIAGKH